MGTRDEIKQIERRAIKQQQQAIVEAQDFKTVLETPEGKRLIHRLLRECGVYRGSFTGDALTTAYQEGRRSLGLWLIEQFLDVPDLYIKFLTENSSGNNTSND